MTTIALLGTVLLLAGNAFFVGAEFALVAARRTQLEPLAQAGSRRAQRTLAAMSQISLMITGAQFGITLCSLGLGALAEPAIAQLLVEPVELVGLPEGTVHPIAFVVALSIVVYLHTVLGEMVPKNIALAGPDRLALWLGPPMWWFTVSIKPLLVALEWLTRTLLRMWGIQSTAEVKTVYTVDELASLVTESRTEGLLDEQDHRRITGALKLTTRRAGEIMRPWSDVFTVPDNVTPAALEAMATRTGRARYPVIDRTTRTIRGVVHIKETLGMSDEQRNEPLSAAAIRPLAVVSPDTPLADLLVRMRRDRSHLVLVSDGSAPLGVVALDDVLSALVGT